MSRVLTVSRRVMERATSMPTAVAIREKNFGIWDEITWTQYWSQAELVGHALLAMGIEPGDRIAIHSENRREWLYGDIGITAVRAATVGLYPTNPAPEVLHVMRDSGARILIAEDQEQVDKALEVLDELPDLERIVYLEPRGVRGRYTHEKLLYWDDFLELGRAHAQTHPGGVEARMDCADEEDLATLIYTSGTTGPPKGVMLSVGNINFVLSRIIEHSAFVSPPPSTQDLVVSYLPLCHVAERIFTIWFNAGTGAQVNFAESIDTVQQNIREIQPTILMGVPRIWEKLITGMHIRMSGASALKRANFAFWMWVSRWIGKTLVANEGRHTVGTRIAYSVGWIFLYRALRERLGVSKLRYAASGAAPVAPEVLVFFMGIGLPMCELYGMTENTGYATTNFPGRVKVGTVGEPQPQAEVRIAENGEILTRHPAVFAGYWRNPQATAEVVDSDGWLHTGDVGEWVDGTHIKITDRIKDVIITAGGKNISPSEIENALKASPYIKEAVVIGDKRKYLTALIGIELDAVGSWAQAKKVPYTTYHDLSEKPEVVALVQQIVNEANKKFASVETIKKFAMLPKELDHDEGELTATQKVKRSAVVGQFEDQIESMYKAAV